MTRQRVREFQKAMPFAPFLIHLADGRSVPVVHPEFMLLPPRGRTLVVFQPNNAMNVVDLRLVTDLEPMRRGKPRARRRRIE